MDHAANYSEPVVNTALNVPAATFDHMIKILTALSNEDALSIFFYLKNGVGSSKDAIQILNLTQKRFYSRLKDLLDVGLIEKVEGKYKYTALGEAVSRLDFYMMQVLENKERLALIDQLNKNSSLPSADIDQLRDVIIQQSGVIEGALHQILYGNQSKVEPFTDFDKGVDMLIKAINSSKNTILLASRYFHTGVMEATHKADKRGVKVKVVMGKENLTKKIEMIKLFLSPKLIKSMNEFANDGVENKIRETDLQYSYCVIDDDKCFFEFPSFEDQPSIGFFVTDKKINCKFKELFNAQWEKGEVKKMPEFFNKVGEILK